MYDWRISIRERARSIAWREAGAVERLRWRVSDIPDEEIERHLPDD